MAEKHFHEQRKFAREYLVPHLEKFIPDFRQKTVLEVGCAEAGFLDYLNEIGMKGVGIELEANRVALAKRLTPRSEVYQGDITDASLLETISTRFDVVVMRDVIEHIPEREKALKVIREFLQPGGYAFITFPPRFSPFAGHQQHAHSFLKLTPYVHLWPEFIWYPVGKMLGEEREYLDSVMHNYRIGLSVRHFEKMIQTTGFRAVVRDVFLFRPIFKYRMGTPIIKFPNVPFLREFLATGCEYLLQKTD